jgi:lipoprotein Spr
MRPYVKYATLASLIFYLSACKHHQSVSTSSGNPKPKPEVLKAEKPSNSIKKQYAVKLGVSESDIKNESLYRFINEWSGVPYKYAGKNKNGIDCSGLTTTLYLNLYKKTISSSTKALVGEVKKIKESDLKEGDLVFFITNEKSISHVGVYLQNNKFVHASTKKGVMISDLNEPYFKKTYACSGRVK